MQGGKRPSIFDEVRRRGGCGSDTMMGGGVEAGVSVVMLVVLVIASYWFYKCCWKQDTPAAPATTTAATTTATAAATTTATAAATKPASFISGSGMEWIPANVSMVPHDEQVYVSMMAGEVANNIGPSTSVLAPVSAAVAISSSGPNTMVLVSKDPVMGTNPVVSGNTPPMILSAASSIHPATTVLAPVPAATLRPDTSVLYLAAAGTVQPGRTVLAQM